MCERSNADRCGPSKEPSQRAFTPVTNPQNYLCVLCVHEGLSKTEHDEVDVRHETVSSHSRRVNLKKVSDQVTVYIKVWPYPQTRSP
jgi:hypothetical protein